MSAGSNGLSRKTSIIIPTYNGKDYLQDCVYAIRRHTRSPYELIVVDNGSRDGTAEYCLRERIPFISLARNLGFPAACNAGLRMASGDALLLLNNDVLVTDGWLDGLLDCLYSADDIGLVGPMTNYASGKQQSEFPYTDIRDMTSKHKRIKPNRWIEVSRIVGLCMLIRRSLLQAIGLLDERFSPGHYEDDDYCYRAVKEGFRIMIARNIFVFHHGSASFVRDGESAVQALIAANKRKFIEKWGVDPSLYQ